MCEYREDVKQYSNCKLSSINRRHEIVVRYIYQCDFPIPTGDVCDGRFLKPVFKKRGYTLLIGDCPACNAANAPLETPVFIIVRATPGVKRSYC